MFKTPGKEHYARLVQGLSNWQVLSSKSNCNICYIWSSGYTFGVQGTHLEFRVHIWSSGYTFGVQVHIWSSGYTFGLCTPVSSLDEITTVGSVV